MQDPWIRWLSAAWDDHDIDTVVQIGAGDGQTVEALLQGPARRIVLIEPEPELAMTLRARARGHNRVEVLGVAVSDHCGDALLRRMSVPGMSAIVPPTDLLTLFPGLRELGQTPVSVVDMETLIKRLKLEDPAPGAAHVLRIDAPGSEAAILRQIGTLPLQFGYLSVRSSDRALYDQPPVDSDLLETLEAKGYRVDARWTDDPDFPEYGLRFDPAVRRITELTRTLAEKDATIAALRDAQQGFDKDRETWQTQLEAARDDARLAMRLQTLQAADLADLQRRFADMADEKRHQDALLQQVTARLGVAADYLRQLGPQGLGTEAADAIGFAPAEPTAQDNADEGAPT